MILTDVLQAWNYWTKTPDVLSNASNAVGFAVSNPSTLIFKPTATAIKTADPMPNGVSFADGTTAEKIANNPITKLANVLSVTKKTTVQNSDGSMTRQNQILNLPNVIDNQVADTAGAIFGSSTFWKYALIAGGAFALYKAGGAFIEEKGGQLARSRNR